MTAPHTISIDNVNYVRADSVSLDATERQIVITEGRWNFVGDVADTDEGIVISNASVIIYWGTTRGLGQLALEGATDTTKLGAIGTVHVPIHSVIARINVTSDL